MEDVYFIRECDGGPIKIGRSKDVASRFRSIQTSTWRDLELVAVMVGAGRETERDLHDRFAHLRLAGEWFVDADELVTFVEGLPPFESLPARGLDGATRSEYARSWRSRNREYVQAYNVARRVDHPETTCDVCSRTFKPGRADQLVCSRSCRERKRYLRRKASGCLSFR